jgi:5,10-methylene-tetrahydrofolate dehydrogenase/methenyl tetrahydrofolate cyclohydrolase
VPHVVNPQWVQEGAIVVDVGTCWIDPHQIDTEIIDFVPEKMEGEGDGGQDGDSGKRGFQ